MTNRTDLLNPQGEASRVLIRHADRLLVVQHRDHHELLSLDNNGATWSDNPTRLWELAPARQPPAMLLGSGAAVQQAKRSEPPPATCVGLAHSWDLSEWWVPSDRPSSTCRTLRTSLRG